MKTFYDLFSEHFPYFTNAPKGWKNSIRHNLSMHRAFQKNENPRHVNYQRGALWAIKPNMIQRMDEQVKKDSRKCIASIKNAMARPGMNFFVTLYSV